MSTPVSAFAVYSQNKTQNYNKRKQKKINQKAKAAVAVQASKPAVTIPDNVLKAVAQKLKTKPKKSKQANNQNKKTKENGMNKVQKSVKQAKKTKVSAVTPPENVFYLNGQESDEEPPLLVPAGSSEYAVTSETDSSNNGDIMDCVPATTNSAEEGLKVFKWMIAPFKSNDFFKNIWEKKPMHIPRKNSKYYKQVISTPIIDDMLRNQNIRYTRNIDITSYVDGQRRTHNIEGEPRAMPRAVWEEYLDGCSVRLKNPQTFLPKMHLINATLQELFNTFVGANVYLTPPDSQGFAPHYDDIEAFILQVEGKKHWRVYRPLSENETLPRFSSRNFDQNEIGKPILEVTLEAGDLLYFPRGYVHQAVTVDGEHSLHVTLSVYQKHSWADMFEKLIPAALQNAIEDNVELRQGLPFDIYDNFGLVNADVNTPRKAELTRLIHRLCDKIKENLPIDSAVDEMAKQFQHTALPPVLTDFEKMVTNFGDHDRMVRNGKVVQRVEIQLDTRIRLLRKNILRMVAETAPDQAGEKVAILIYFNVDNSLEYEGRDPQHIQVDESWIPAVETLTMSYPEYVSVESLGGDSESKNMEIANILWDTGLVMADQPLGYDSD